MSRKIKTVSRRKSQITNSTQEPAFPPFVRSSNQPRRVWMREPSNNFSTLWSGFSVTLTRTTLKRATMSSTYSSTNLRTKPTASSSFSSKSLSMPFWVCLKSMWRTWRKETILMSSMQKYWATSAWNLIRTLSRTLLDAWEISSLSLQVPFSGAKGTTSTTHTWTISSKWSRSSMRIKATLHRKPTD